MHLGVFWTCCWSSNTAVMSSCKVGHHTLSPPTHQIHLEHFISFSSLKPNRTEIISGWWSKCGIINVHILIPLESTPAVQQRCRESEFWMRLGLNDVTTLFLYYPSGVTVLTAAPALITLAVQSKSKSGNESIGGVFFKKQTNMEIIFKRFFPLTWHRLKETIFILFASLLLTGSTTQCNDSVLCNKSFLCNKSLSKSTLQC